MSGKKSFFTGLVLGSIAASATVYALKTEKGKEFAAKAKDSFKDMASKVEDSIENKDEIIEFVNDYISDKTNSIVSFGSKKETSESEIIEKELNRLKKEIESIESSI
ncbi:MAG: hypothetical protein K0S34_2018 [Bacillales bacterium]|jgi:gas vesicle protein|nr:hypothetical protein [Bacillales bacterium]